MNNQPSVNIPSVNIPSVNIPPVNQLPVNQPSANHPFQHPPTHWSNSIVHCDKGRKQPRKLNKCSQYKTLKTFFLQYY